MTPYEILNIQPTATEEEIKSAYREKAMQFHPDRNHSPDAAEKFKEVQSAYEQLTKQNQSLGGFDPFDIFNSFFGFNHGEPQQRGRDIFAEHTISFMEAARGCEATINIRRGEICPTCKGTCAAPGGINNCPACAGQGMVSFRHGNVHVQRTCGQCGGKGKTITKTCTDCAGDGYVKDTVAIAVQMPQGISDGDSICLHGYGEKKGKPGDAYIQIHVKPHPLFKRQGDNLLIIVPITYNQAVFGCTLSVPTLDGGQEITIAPETKSGSEIRLSGLGLRNAQTRRKGDYIIKVEIDVSIPKDEKFSKLIKKLDKMEISAVREEFTKQLKEIH